MKRKENTKVQCGPCMCDQESAKEVGCREVGEGERLAEVNKSRVGGLERKLDAGLSRQGAGDNREGGSQAGIRVPGSPEKKDLRRKKG